MNATHPLLALLACLCLSLTFSDSMVAQENDGLSVLNHYVGVWDCRFSIKSQKAGTEPQEFTGVVEAKWVLGDRFLEQTGSYQIGQDSEPFVIRTIISHDDQQNQYRFDYYNSDGSRYDGQGEWNAANKTMTSKMVNESTGDATIIVANFSEPDVEKWTIRTSNEEGETVLEISGVNKRRKGTEKKGRESRK